MKESKDVNVLIAEISKDITFIRSTVERLEKSIEDIKESYVTKEEFKPVKSIVYGASSFILLSVFTAIVAAVIIK